MIVITTPTGTIGRQVLHNVLAGDQPVRVVVRDPARLDAQVRDRVDGVPGSHGDPGVVTRALRDATALFWLPPGNPGLASIDDVFSGFTRPALDAIKPVERVVAIS